MSTALVRKALLLDSQDGLDVSAARRKQDAQGSKSGQKHLKKERPKLKRKQQKNNLCKSKKIKTLEDDYLKYKDSDHTEDNLLMISKLSQLDDSQSDIVDKISQHKKDNRRHTQQKDKPQSAQQSVFSDRDFDKFEEEYDFNFWGK